MPRRRRQATVRSTNGRPHGGPRRFARGFAAGRAPCPCSGLRLARPSRLRTSPASRAMPLAGDPDPAWSGSSQRAAPAAVPGRRRGERARVYVLSAGRRRSELGSCRTGPPGHVRAGGPPQTDAIRALSDTRRSDARRAPSRSSPHRPLALDGHHMEAAQAPTAGCRASAGFGSRRSPRRSASAPPS